MEAELEQNKSLCLESCCRLELIKNGNFQFLKCRLQELRTKLEINSLHNLKARKRYYVLTQYVSG